MKPFLWFLFLFALVYIRKLNSYILNFINIGFIIFFYFSNFDFIHLFR